MFSNLLYLKVDKLDESGKVIKTLPFPSASDQIILGTYTYEAKRMGGTPMITDSFYFPRCLNDEWNRDGYSEVYAEYENEKFCVTSVPSSTKDNSTLLFKHEITLVSRREILDNTLFFDAVAKDSDMFSVDKYRSNQTSFSFSGTIYEFVDRINSSLAYIGVYNPKAKEENSKGYHVEIVEGYGTDDIKELSFSDQYITDVLQEIYNTFGLTYYWKGNTCYVGKCENDLTDENDIIKYGVNDALISVNEENTNNKIIDMVTGYGSSDNIPFYYPNDDEFGKAIYKTSLIEESQVTIALSKLQKNVGGDYTKTYQFCKRIGDTTGIIPITQLNTPFNGLVIKSGESFVRIKTFVINAKAGTKIHEAEIKTSHTTIDSVAIKSDTFESYIEVLKKTDNKYEGNRTDWNGKYNGVYECVEAGLYLVTLRETITVVSKTGRSISVDNAINYNYQGSLEVDYQNQSEYYWKYDKGTIEYENSGIEVVAPSITPFAKSVVTFVTKNDPSVTVYTYYEFSEVIDTTTEADAAKVYISGREWIMPTNKLMPSVYRNTGGAQRFYFAIENPSEEYRDIYLNPNTNKQYEFKNKYKDANPHQGSTSFDDIKPTIRDIRNDVIQADGLGQLFGEIADVAFDSTDSDVKDGDGNYVHQYFYIKLHKFSGEFGFNLFSSALEEEAKIEMIDCQGCPACSFPIRVVWNAAKNKCYNCVSVDKDGNLKSLRTEANDYILSDTEAQLDTLNQNTMLSEVWIAVQKDASTLGVVMPNVNGNFKPQRGDKFVITGINPPKVLTLAAEKRLDKALIKYMSENNVDKFNYSVKFSRIYLVEHPNFAQKLNENAKVCLEYNGVRHELFVNNYSVKRDGKILAEVNVELTESVEPTESDIKQIIDSVKNSISFGTSGGSGKFNASTTDKLYLSKLKDDTAQGLITFLKGLKSQDVIKAINGISLGNGENYVNGNGDANLSDVIVDRLHDKNSTPSDRVIIGAQGFDLYLGDDGKSHLYVDYLTARTRMFAASVEIRKVSYSGGTTIFSNAGSQIVKVSYIWDAAKEKVIAYKCYAFADDGTTKTMNWWHVGMMALCQTFNVKAGELEKLENRYYWRLVVGVGQEKLDGKLYDYVILSNIKEFQGNLLTIPTYSDKTLANEQKKKLVWGNVMVEVTMDEGMQTLASLFAEQEGKDVDDNGTKIADRIFYGYDGEKPDAPAPYDVIVQVGDQIRWKKYGNIIKLSTSTEDNATDNATDNAPAITMYHKLGAPHYTGSLDTNGNKIINPYQWKIITTIISPEKVMHNTDNFQLFQGTPDNIIDPITIMYDIVPSVVYYTRHPSTQTTTPTDITFSLRKRTGNKVETLTDAQIYAEYTLLDGSSNTKLLANKALSDIGNLYQITSVKLKSTIKEADHEDVVVTYDLPVLTDGDNGDPGSDGLDALEVTIKNAPLVFDTDDNGVVSSSAIQNAEIWVTRDGKNVIADIKNPSITDSLNFTVESDNAVIRKTSECLQIALKGIGIAKETVNGNAVSKTSGYVVVSFNDGTNMFQRQILFNVNVSRFNSSVIQTAKLYEQKYTEVSKKYEALPEEVRNKESFSEYNSAIKQTAREISLSVTEEAAKKRNLLVNSDFARNVGFYIYLNAYATIERFDRHNNENVFYSYPLNQAFYSKLMWEGSKAGDVDRGSHNISIVIGKKYTLSCWAKVSDTSVPLTLQVYSQAAKTGNSATASKGDLLNQEVTLDAANVWQLISYTFEVKGDYAYCSVRLYFQPLSNTRIKGYISQPMLEQADSYNGWTLAEEDYVYRNGNILDNTRYLNVGGNLAQVGTIINNAKDNCSMSEANVDLATTDRRAGTLLRYKIPLEAHTDYVLSFYVRSKDLDSKQNVICTINLDSGVFFAEGYTENESVGYISNYISLHGNSPTSGYMQFSSIPQDWTKVCYHFSLNSKNTAQPISILTYAQNGAGSLQICQPKLEKAVTNTAWTEATQDVAFKDKYKRAGIDLDAETIRLSAERTIIDGDLHLKGILVENTAEPVKADSFPIVCDLKQNKSIAVGTYTGTESYSTGSEMRYVLLPMVYDVPCINEDGNETTVAGLKESGVKLTIFSKYNPVVSKWATASRLRYRDSEANSDWGNLRPYEILHAAITVVYADPRIAFKKNYESDANSKVFPEGSLYPSYKEGRYKHGCFVCNGRRGRILLLMPGQALHLTSSVEKWGNEDVLMWYVDNASEFEPTSKNVQFGDSGHTYNWEHAAYSDTHDNSFPGDTINGMESYRYEDVLFAPPQLSNDYPADDAFGMNVVKSGVSLSIRLY
nr:MAG TPA: hypothetical protein [Caudoviricetes sp.]